MPDVCVAGPGNVIEIKATDYTVFINSKDEDEMNTWYQELLK